MRAAVAALAVLAMAALALASPAPGDDASGALVEGSELARTFGGPRKRLMLLLPIVYKLGVITTLLGVLIALVVKSVAIGLLLLALGAANLAAVTKLKSHAQPGWSGGSPVHVHLHGASVGSSQHHAYAAWEPPPPPRPHYSEHYEEHPPYRRR